jgi:Carbamoyl-phosphate synthase L chain, ATP binding domain
VRVLTISIDNWYTGGRLPKVLSDAGFDEAVLCCSDDLAAQTRHVQRRYLVKSSPTEVTGDELLTALVRAVNEWEPALLIPTDEGSTGFLHWLACCSHRRRRDEVLRLRPLIEYSLGNPRFYRRLHSKHRTLSLAAKCSVPTPAMCVTDRVGRALRFAERVGYPVVVKSDRSAAGCGVRMCHSADQVRDAYRELLPSDWKRRIYWRLYQRSPWQHWELARYRDQVPLHVQRAIPGDCVMFSFVALQGRIIAGGGLLKEQTYPSECGPSSVVRVIEHDGMRQAAARIVARVGYSGFGSMDFIREPGTGRAVFLEFNYRSVPAHYLGPTIGVRYCLALRLALEGGQPSAVVNPALNKVVAMFPQEDCRDPESPYFRTAARDVPEDDPELLKALLARAAQLSSR